MLTTPDNLHLLDDDLQDELLHHLSRDGGEADWPVVPWVLLLALFEDWSDTGLSPVLRHSSSPLLSSRTSQRWWRDVQQWHPPAPSAFVGAFHRGPWICGHSGHKIWRKVPHVSDCLTKLWKPAHTDRKPKGQTFPILTEGQAPWCPLL